MKKSSCVFIIASVYLLCRYDAVDEYITAVPWVPCILRHPIFVYHFAFFYFHRGQLKLQKPQDDKFVFFCFCFLVN